MPFDPHPPSGDLPALDEIFEALPYGAVLLDANDTVVAWNNWLARTSGRVAEDMLGHSLFSCFDLPRKGALSLKWAREQNRPQVLSQKLHGYFLPIPFPQDHISGFGFMQQETTITPLRNRPGHLLIIIRDVTPAVIGEWRLKALQTELDQAVAMAEWANRAKSEFLTMASHDLRTPMNGVLGFASLLSETELDEEQRDYLNAMQSSGKMMVTLLKDILDFSRMEAGQMEILPSRFALRPAIEKMLRLSSNMAEDKELSLTIDFDPSLPEIIECDETRLQQILVNLVSNALKFTEEGGVEVRVGGQKLESDAPPPQWMLEVSVKDTGAGISSEDLSSLFQPFKQVGEHSKRAGGSGLGLSICKRLCELMQGTLEVQSEPGQGSTFSFRIPVDIAQDGTAAAAESDEEGEEPATADQPRPRTLRGMRALLVDDVAMNRKLGSVLLRKLGMDNDTASSGQEALDLLRSRRYDVVFLDLKMPVMDGIETARRIRAGEAGTSAKEAFLCALTALAGLEHRQQCQAVGMNDFLAKPLRREELIQVLAKL